ncbi:MAG: NAD-dependent epimerase/dehydratase family protein [Euryarchaeota archaeon]|nr:NAD-dependent epimerase/dehydratase family protein [Euryarchaeota archaeon]
MSEYDKAEGAAKVCVTGGAGFIGRHLSRVLVERGLHVIGIDDFSGADRRALMEFDGVPNYSFVEGDVRDPEIIRYALEDCRTVFHLAANPEVRVGEQDPVSHVTGNLDTTVAVLEAMRAEGVKEILFTSTSTVYGEADQIPTPEDFGPLLPVSIYGGAKLGAEALISSYCGTFDMRAALFRFANVVGPGSGHGVTVDFVRKLQADPKRLEILGDGRQTKSYVHVHDTVEGMITVFEGAMPEPGYATPYNIGSHDWIPVTEVADTVAEVMGVKPEYSFTGGARGGGGWKGDVPRMMLDVKKLLGLGWSPAYTSRDAIKDTARWLVGEEKATTET